jgi:hypothetical protein
MPPKSCQSKKCRAFTRINKVYSDPKATIHG